MASLLTTSKDTFTQVDDGDSTGGNLPDDLDLVLDRTKPSRSLESLRLELEQFYRPETDLE
jgi:hypothetical protein